MYSEPPKVISNIKTKKFDEVSKKKKGIPKKRKKGEKEKQLDEIMKRKKKNVVEINNSIDILNNALNNINPTPDELFKNNML